MRFSTERFVKNADAGVRKLLPESHRRALDGKEVQNGQIEYSADGENWCLYPVDVAWCMN